MFDLLIKNGMIVDSSGEFYGNIGIKDGKIAALLIGGEECNAEIIIDAEGKLVVPGFIDTHAHLNEPGYEWREDYAHGTRAAAAGGYTTIIDMPLQNSPAITTAELFVAKKKKVSENAYVDFALWGGLVPDNFDEIEKMAEEGAVAFKSFIGPVSEDYRTLTYGQVYEILERIAGKDIRAGFHCEDFSIIKNQEKILKDKKNPDWNDFLKSRPDSAEVVATEAVLRMAEETGAKVHICHVSSPRAAKAITESLNRGCDVTCETCSHYLSLTSEDLKENGPLFKCAPPLKNNKDIEELWKYVEGELFSGIASDHSPSSKKEKYEEILGKRIETVFDVWGGISGIQSGVQVSISEGMGKRKIEPHIIVKAMAEKPARAFGIYGIKGDLKPGFDADILIIDPLKEWEITEDSLYYVNKISAFTGMTGRGIPLMTILRGKIIAENGKIICDKPHGRFVGKVKSHEQSERK